MARCVGASFALLAALAALPSAAAIRDAFDAGDGLAVEMGDSTAGAVASMLQTAPAHTCGVLKPKHKCLGFVQDAHHFQTFTPLACSQVCNDQAYEDDAGPPITCCEFRKGGTVLENDCVGFTDTPANTKFHLQIQESDDETTSAACCGKDCQDQSTAQSKRPASDSGDSTGSADSEDPVVRHPSQPQDQTSPHQKHQDTMIDRPVTVKRRWEVWDPQAGAADPEKTTDLKIMISIPGKPFKGIVKKFRKDHTVADLRFFLSTTLHSMGATKPFNIKHRGQLITDDALTLDGAGLVGCTIFVEVA